MRRRYVAIVIFFAMALLVAATVLTIPRKGRTLHDEFEKCEDDLHRYGHLFARIYPTLSSLEKHDLVGDGSVTFERINKILGPRLEPNPPGLAVSYSAQIGEFVTQDLDPWGNSYLVRIEVTGAENTFLEVEFSSYGADGIPSDDDHRMGVLVRK